MENGGRFPASVVETRGMPAHRIVLTGIACIPEGRKVFPKLSVVENLRLGAYQERDAGKIAGRLAQVFGIFPRLAERAIGLCAPRTRVIYFDDVAEFVSAARACGLPAEQFVNAAKLRRDLAQFWVL